MCPSLAEPDSVGISKSNSRRVSHETRHESESFSMLIASNEPQANEKVFWCSNFSKMLPRCGRAAHICGANKTVWELQQKSKRELEESQLPLKMKG